MLFTIRRKKYNLFKYNKVGYAYSIRGLQSIAAIGYASYCPKPKVLYCNRELERRFPRAHWIKHFFNTSV